MVNNDVLLGKSLGFFEDLMAVSEDDISTAQAIMQIVSTLLSLQAYHELKKSPEAL